MNLIKPQLKRKIETMLKYKIDSKINGVYLVTNSKFLADNILQITYNLERSLFQMKKVILICELKNHEMSIDDLKKLETLVLKRLETMHQNVKTELSKPNLKNPETKNEIQIL